MKGCAWVLGSGLAIGLACGGLVAFECDEDTQCTSETQQGVCQPTGYCSFPDDECPSGQRYGDRAASGVAGRCVPIGGSTDVAVDDSSGDDPSTSGTPGSDTLPTSTIDPPDTSTSTSTSASTSTSSTTLPATSDAEDTEDPPDTTEQAQIFEVSFGERADADVKRVTYDTFLDSNAAVHNFGVHGDLHTWEWDSSATSLLRFDLTFIPPGATIVEATLELWSDAEGGTLQSGSLAGFRMLEAWEEGEYDWESGVANWEYRLPGVVWTTAGARQGSHADEILFEFDLAEFDTAYEVSIPPEVVQAWVDDPDDNHGMAIYGQPPATGATAWVLSSECWWFEEGRPLLTIVYEE
jgi:hypothetical protein